MRALVIYESMFGNTKAVAEAVTEGIRTRLEVDLIEIGHAPSRVPDDVALLVVGGPTHAHGMSKPESRADAGRRTGDQLVSQGIGLREWLAGLEAPVRPIPVAVFDTRIKGPSLIWGSAAKAATGLLDRSFDLIRGPESFLVDGPTGPLHDRLLPAELDRARAWGAAIAEVVHATAVRAGT